jgi:LAS superfamily LD-carboxypeptidase LdcB
MKKFVFLLMVTVAFNLSAQDLKSMTKSAETMAKSSDSSSFIEKFAGDQVTKLTKKLNLSEAQQKQVSSLVVSQLKSEKVQKLISSFSPEQLLGSAAQSEISKTIMGDSAFKSGMDKILTDEQKKIQL